MTTKTLLHYERTQAEKALHREHRLAEVYLGTYQPTAQDKAIEAQNTFAEWLSMPTWAACSNPAQDQRRRRVHDFADKLASIERPAWQSITDMQKFLAMLPPNVSVLDTLAGFIADGYPVPPQPARRPIIKPQDLPASLPLFWCEDCHAFIDGHNLAVSCDEGHHAPLESLDDSLSSI